MSAVLLRSLPPEVKSHVTVNLPEDASYAVLREMLMKWERGIQKWSSSLVSGGNAHSDAMDVDQIGQVKGGDKGKDKGKGKGKDKGKGKGKGKGYHPQQQQYQQHYHQHYGQEKGKGKKGKDGGKHQQQWSTWSKGKGKESKGKGQGQAQQNQCRLCGQCGHWKNECWMNQHKVWAVNESEAFSQNHASIPNPSTSTAGANQQAKVKRVFCLTENADDIVDSSSASIRMLQCFTIHDAGDPFLSMPRPEHEAFDLTLDDDRDIGCGCVQVVVESIEDEYCTDSWEQVSYPDKQVYEIALGSGADVSVMPFDWASLG